MRAFLFVTTIAWGLLTGFVETLPTAHAAPTTAKAAPKKVAKRPSIWQTDFAKAQQEAKRLNRPMIVHFYADWCGPCKKMEAEVLGTEELARQINNRFIAVKINSDKHIDLAEKFKVETLPTDIFLEPGGRIISRSDKAQSKSEYLSRLARVDARWAQTKKQHIAGSTKENPGDSNQGPQLGGPSLGSPNESPKAPEAPATAKTAPAAPEPKATTPAIDAAPAEPGPRVNMQEFVGLDGYSPVTLAREKKWVKGSSSHTSFFQGIKYWFVDAEEVSQFNAYAERFAPRLLGCDPVLLWKHDRAFQGSTQFGAFYAGELYLFTSAETRKEFKQRPEQYIRAKHVLRPDEIERLGIRRAAAEPEKKSG